MMRGLNENESAVIAVARAQPMLQQVERWASVNSGTRNMAGLAEVAAMLAGAFGVLPGNIANP